MQNQSLPTNQPAGEFVADTGRKSWLSAVIFAAVVLVATVLIILNRQFLLDQYTVWRFAPTSELVALADRAGIGEQGKFYLYASQASIDDREQFNRACGSLQNEKTVVIGCYTSPAKRIYIYNVTDPQLDGVRETSAAHEMLHAAYDRLSSTDRKRVDTLVLEQKKQITDKRLLSLIKHYEETEPDAVVNELHSIIGTEVRSLSPELEAYYARYFLNRSAVVALKEKYEKVFEDLSTRQDQLVDQLNQLSASVTSRQAAYQTAMSSLNADIESFNGWAKSSAANEQQYSVRRAELQARVTALETERLSINADIDLYATKKAELDALNIQATTLNQHIDSKLSPAQSF